MTATRTDMSRAKIKLHPDDNVEIVVADGLEVPRGHKLAFREIAVGAPIVKFGQLIGIAKEKIAPGAHVHVHNVRMPEGTEYLLSSFGEQSGALKAARTNSLPSVFRGYRRPDGSAGIRNYVVIASTVNCSATVVKAICRRFEREDLLKFGVDGIVPVTHTMGCAQEIGGLGYRVLNRTIAGWVFHPNVVGAVVVGLGCEGTTFSSILKAGSSADGDWRPIEQFGIQDKGGTAIAIEEGVAAVRRVLARLPRVEREDLPVSGLRLALNCGGSDAFSAITANPVLGHASDILVSMGATAALAEIPECHGAEEMLYARAVDGFVRERLNSIFQWWENYTRSHGVEHNDNLAPGNIAGGITTILEKTLGAVAKGGSAPLTEVLEYAEPICRSGFVLMNTPGFDPVSVTGLVAGGCNMVAFTTGRGSVYGCGIAPTIKISTTSELARRMSGDIDFDAGRLLETGDIDTIAQELFREIIEVASGRKTCSERLGLGWEEFVPWSLGETL